MQCETGCMRFDGGEVKHHRNCPYYPESLTKMWHDREAELEAEINRLTRSMSQMREDFRRIEMLAEQHCPADASIKHGD